jgi:hypothetical protein
LNSLSSKILSPARPSSGVYFQSCVGSALPPLCCFIEALVFAPSPHKLLTVSEHTKSFARASPRGMCAASSTVAHVNESSKMKALQTEQSGNEHDVSRHWHSVNNSETLS